MASQNFEPIHFTDLKDQIDGKSPLLGALFLFFLLFFTILFVYFLYICTQRHVDGGGPTPSNPNAPPDRPRSAEAGLDPATISGLPMIPYVYSNKSSPEAECAICLSMFSEGDKVKVLPLCRHGFHSDCVDKWLRTRSSCPLCRACLHRVDSSTHEREPEIP